jgi:putative ABC transport system ATP-binding protein
MHALEARELYRFFHTGDEEVRALRGVDLALDAGEMIALTGPSGSGKSTLLMCLAGLDEPDGGSVLVMGGTMTRRPETEKTRLRSKHLGIMLQKDNLFAHLTVAQNITAAQAAGGQTDNVYAAEILQRIGLGKRAGSLPAQLSGGERARAGLAAALSGKPDILILDEPTGEVDAETEGRILTVLREHCQGGGSVIVATHNHAVARKADSMLALRDGKVEDAKDNRRT